MCQYGSPHVTADVGGAEGERWEWRVSELQPPTLPSPPLPLALASLVHRPASHCSRGRESGCCFPQISVPSAPSFTFVSKARFFYLSSGSGLCPLLTSSGPLQGRLQSMLSAGNPWASPPMLLHQHLPPSLCWHHLSAVPWSLQLSLLTSPWTPCSNILTSSRPLTLLMMSHLSHGTG